MLSWLMGNDSEDTPSPSGNGLVAELSADHRRCDTLWSIAETAARAGDVEASKTAYEEFEAAMYAHLGFEEEHLFPATELALGLRGGPTLVMRNEHEQMCKLMSEMSAAAKRGDTTVLADLGDTLLMLIGQHNHKEENVLYPMAQQALGPLWDEISPRRKAYERGLHGPVSAQCQCSCKRGAE